VQRRSDADYVIILLSRNSSVSCCMIFWGGWGECGCWADFEAVLEGMLQLDTNIKNLPPTPECLGPDVYWAQDERRNDPCPSQ
jgi:hypothetical protein